MYSRIQTQGADWKKKGMKICVLQLPEHTMLTAGWTFSRQAAVPLCGSGTDTPGMVTMEPAGGMSSRIQSGSQASIPARPGSVLDVL